MKKKFENLLVWKSARELVSKIYTKIIESVGRGFSLAKTKQLRVMARSLAVGGRRSNPQRLNGLLRLRLAMTPSSFYINH